MSHLSCPRCDGLMRLEKIIYDGETCTSWICTRCGEVLDQVILENRTLLEGVEIEKQKQPHSVPITAR